MAADKVTLGKSFAQELLARIPEDQRETVGAILQSDDVAEALGAGALRQQDYSRAMNETSEWKKSLDSWYETNRALVAKATDPNPRQPGDPTPVPSGFSKEDAEALINAREQGAVAFIAHTTMLSAKHQQAFGEVLDIPGLLADPDVSKVGLQGVYEKKYGAQIAEKAKLAQDADIQKRVDAGVAEKLKGHLAQPPYPVSSSFVSPLDSMEGAPAVSDSVVDKAVTQYNELVAKKLAGGAAG